MCGKPMTIGIDARMLGKGFGLARYVEALVTALDTLKHEYQIVLFLRSENWDVFTPTTDRFTKVLADIPWYSVAEQVLLPRIIKKAGVDMMHFPHFNVPLWYRGRFLVTIHDLTMYHFPRQEATTHGPLVYWLKDRLHRLVVASAVRRAEHIITTSEFTKYDVQKTLGVPLQKMTTVYQAPFSGSAGRVSQDTSFGSPYVLYVGAAYPHKNIEGLLDAWIAYVETYGGEEELLLAGKENYFWYKIAETLQDYPRVTYLGFQTDEQLDALYAGARAFVFPSLYEGFGIPPLEAMQRGLPVLSSTAACMPEVLGDGALFADAGDPEMFAGSLNEILYNEDIRHELQVRAKEVVAQYTPNRFGTETIQIYNQQI